MAIDWPGVGADLVDEYQAYDMRFASKYFHHFEFTETDPLAPVVPLVDVEKFFGTSVLNILIISKPYGWTGVDGGDKGTFSWPPDGYEASKARLIEGYKYFASYETLVWLDMSQDGTECEEESPWVEMMTATEGGIQDMCTELEDYGFTYMGQLTEADKATFIEFATPHFNKQLNG